jgi:signal transduction histidine kinase
LYKNGFRIYPFGEPYEDPLRIDVRKSRKKYSTLGTGELMGQIEIYGENPDLKETSSRGNGLIKTPTYDQLEDFFLLVLERLERYVVDVQKWGLSIEDNLSEEAETKLRADIITLLAKTTDFSEIIDIEYGEDFLENISFTQEDSVTGIVKNLQRIASNSGNQKILKYANRVEKKLVEIRAALEEAQKDISEREAEAQKAKQDLEEQITENLFLKSIKSQDFEEVVSFLHHIGISAANIDILLKGVYAKINRGQKISTKELRQIIEDVSFENTKILSVSKFATKANFKLFTDEAEINLISYIREYINNVIRGVNQSITIRFTNKTGIDKFVKVVRPIELNILIDNLVSNSIKAGADNILIEVGYADNDLLRINFRDDGEGIPKQNQPKIFDLGFTTTTGSGLGLFHIKKIVKDMKGDIKVNEKITKGAEFIIEINK